MSLRTVPPWIDVQRGSAPILLLAPHGGRRLDVRIPGKHKVNDLRTAEVTRELAAALGASTIINAEVDRNQLDLNRVSQVRRDAPWLIDLMADMLTKLVAEAGRATVLVIHGWNVTQLACDVGVGMREDAGGLLPCRPGSATVASEFVAKRLRPLQAAAATDGIAVTIGSRYPAAHPNNLLQMFRAANTPVESEPCPIATLCRDAVVDAVQLELAIPLRWPGSRRERFVALLAETFGERPTARPRSTAERPHARNLRALGGRVTRRRGLQLVAGNLFVMTGIDAGDDGANGGRVVLSEDPSRLSLFTGELSDPSREWTIPPLAYEVSPTGASRFTYAGPLVTFPTHTPFVDLERGLAEGVVVDGALDLTFEPDSTGAAAAPEEGFGGVRGVVVVDGRRHAIATRGFATSVDVPTRVHFPYCRVVVPVGPSGEVMLTADPEMPAEWLDDRLRCTLRGGVWNAGGRIAVHATGDVLLGADAGDLVLEVGSESGWRSTIHARLARLLPVRRPGPLGSVIETTFALIRVDDGRVGWLELSIVRGPDDATC